MKTVIAGLQVGVILLALALVPEESPGQIYLTGVLQDGASANGNTAGSPIWNTLGDELSFANLYVTQPNTGYTGPFLNSGNGAGAGISLALMPGTYQFYFFGDAFPDNNPGFYGLSLFFDGNNNTSPGIAAYSMAGVIGANAVPAGFSTLPLSGNTNYPTPAPGSYIYTLTPVLVPGTLSYSAAGLTVTLTAYGFGSPGSFGVPVLDRVTNLNDSPDGQLDGVGLFELTVTPVPEPSAFLLLLLCCAGAIFRRWTVCSATVGSESPNNHGAEAPDSRLINLRSLSTRVLPPPMCHHGVGGSCQPAYVVAQLVYLHRGEIFRSSRRWVAKRLDQAGGHQHRDVVFLES